MKKIVLYLLLFFWFWLYQVNAEYIQYKMSWTNNIVSWYSTGGYMYLNGNIMTNYWWWSMYLYETIWTGNIVLYWSNSGNIFTIITHTTSNTSTWKIFSEGSGIVGYNYYICSFAVNKCFVKATSTDAHTLWYNMTQNLNGFYWKFYYNYYCPYTALSYWDWDCTKTTASSYLSYYPYIANFSYINPIVYKYCSIKKIWYPYYNSRLYNLNTWSGLIVNQKLYNSSWFDGGVWNYNYDYNGYNYTIAMLYWYMWTNTGRVNTFNSNSWLLDVPFFDFTSDYDFYFLKNTSIYLQSPNNKNINYFALYWSWTTPKLYINNNYVSDLEYNKIYKNWSFLENETNGFEIRLNKGWYQHIKVDFWESGRVYQDKNVCIDTNNNTYIDWSLFTWSLDNLQIQDWSVDIQWTVWDNIPGLSIGNINNALSGSLDINIWVLKQNTWWTDLACISQFDNEWNFNYMNNIQTSITRFLINWNIINLWTRWDLQVLGVNITGWLYDIASFLVNFVPNIILVPTWFIFDYLDEYFGLIWTAIPGWNYCYMWKNIIIPTHKGSGNPWNYDFLFIALMWMWLYKILFDKK